MKITLEELNEIKGKIEKPTINSPKFLKIPVMTKPGFEALFFEKDVNSYGEFCWLLTTPVQIVF